MSNQALLSERQIEAFNNDGYLILPNFYELSEISDIQKGVYEIIGIIANKYDINICRLPFSASTFDNGYMEIIKINRAYGGEIYDAVKQIPAFIRLVSAQK